MLRRQPWFDDSHGSTLFRVIPSGARAGLPLSSDQPERDDQNRECQDERPAERTARTKPIAADPRLRNLIRDRPHAGRLRTVLQRTMPLGWHSESG